jgi:hypothetical protein
MGYGVYQYTANSGLTFAVNIPSDFADALGMSPDTTDPPLDATISPRMGNCRDANGNFRQAVIADQATFAGLPGTTIVVNGITYTWTTYQGESIAPIQANVVNGALLIQGPPGPPGPGSSLAPTLFILPSPQTIYPGGVTVMDVTPPAGSYFVFAALIASTTIAANDISMFIYSGGTVIGFTTGEATVSPGDLVEIVAFAAVTVDGSQNLYMEASCTINTATAENIDNNYGNWNTCLWLIQYA